MIAGFLDVREVAKRLGVTPGAVHRLKDRGTLAYVRLAGRALFRVEVIDRYLADPDAQARRRAVRP